MAYELLDDDVPEEKGYVLLDDEPQRSGVLQTMGNIGAGLVRGAGSIGATLLAPVDVVSDALNGKGLTLEGNRQRRADMDAALQSLGAETDSLAYKGGKLAGEIAGTLPAGGVVGSALTKAASLPQLARAAPALKAIGNAAASGGFRTGGGLGAAGDLAARVTGGALAGGATAGLVEPESAGAGALIGGAFPVAGKAAALGATKVAKSINGVPAPANVQQAARAAIQEGYVVPPTQVRPTLVNSLTEGLGGKLKTRQQASQLNQLVTDKLAKQSVGLGAADDLTLDALQSIRNQAGEAYNTIRKAGEVLSDDAYLQALDKIGAARQGAARSFPGLQNNGVTELVSTMRQPKFDAGDAVDALKVLRENADAAYRSGDNIAGKAAKEAASALESLLERSLEQAGNGQAIRELRRARELIAKTYTVQKALNPSSGSVNALELSKQLRKGAPLSGGLKKAAEFGSAFPHAAKVPEQAGGVPALSALDLAAATASGSPAGILGMLSRPALRAYALSPSVQRGLLDSPAAATGLLAAPSGAGLLGFGVRAAPLAAIDR